MEHRPATGHSRQRIGDWEAGAVIGKAHKGVLVTLVDRMSRFTQARGLPPGGRPGESDHCGDASPLQAPVPDDHL